MEDIYNAKIGVLLATYNGEKYLSEQVDSIFQQAGFNIIIFAHDDGSSDSTKILLEENRQKYQDRFIVLQGASTGSSKSNFMYLIEQALKYRIDYFFFADQDDVWQRQKVKVMMKKMKEVEVAEKPCVIFSDMKVVDENLNEIAPSFFNYINANPERILPNQLIMQSFIAGCSMLVNRKTAELSIYYTNIDNIFMHDWWLALIGAYIGQIFCIKEPLVLYRQHGNNQIGARPLKKIELLRHLFDTLFGDHKEEIKSRVLRSRNFAEELKYVPGLTDEQYEFLDQFSKLGKENKAKRIRFYLKHKLSRNNKRNLIFLLFV